MTEIGASEELEAPHKKRRKTPAAYLLTPSYSLHSMQRLSENAFAVKCPCGANSFGGCVCTAVNLREKREKAGQSAIYTP